MGNAIYFSELRGTGEHRAAEVDEVEVTTASDLYDVRDDGTLKYIQMADIDLSGYSDWDPICHLYTAAFTGEYDGNGYIISNLTMSNPTLQGAYIGLFGSAIGAVFTNLVVLDASINTDIAIGVLVGYSETSLYTRCRSNGSITQSDTSNSETGGLIGYSWDDDIIRCSSLCTINSAAVYTGGLFGYLDESYVKDCYYKGELTGQDKIGGLTGESYGATIIDTTYTAAVINSTGVYTDAFLGNATGYTTANCYYDGTITTKTSIAAISKTTTQLKTQSSYFGSWNFRTVWDISYSRNDGYPFLQHEYDVVFWNRMRNLRHKDASFVRSRKFTHYDGSNWKRVNI